MPTNLQLNRLDCLKRIDASTPPVTTYRYFRITVDTNFGGTQSLVNDAYVLSGMTQYPAVPMTANNAPAPLVASASSISQQPFRAFDGFILNAWVTASGVVAAYLQIDLGSGNEIIPTGLRLVMFSDASNANANAGKLQASNNGTTWTDILSYDRSILGNAVLDQTFNVV